tara:strand:+ start:146 stop:1090 length:945 start_codon:yes stop_codon:yes gene_type:complete
MTRICVAAFYHFAKLDDFAEYKNLLLDKCNSLDLLGTILLANEGINGTISGSASSISDILSFIRSDERLKNLVHKESYAEEPPFLRMKVRLKSEIVAMGVNNINPSNIKGTYVKPEDWNDLISDPDVIVVDTRNNYEVEIGTFSDAINPGTKSFRELPDWINQNQEMLRKKKVAMFCTGGIRCEKSTAFMKELGFKDVFHLEGGILKYLEMIQKEKSLWRGECFVFDQRVSVGHGLKVGSYDLCHACRSAINEQDKLSPYYCLGISCPKCFGKISEERRGRFAERQKQIELAEKRTEKHLGARKLSKSIDPIKK